jgi:hypothetical protein
MGSNERYVCFAWRMMNARDERRDPTRLAAVGSAGNFANRGELTPLPPINCHDSSPASDLRGICTRIRRSRTADDSEAMAMRRSAGGSYAITYHSKALATSNGLDVAPRACRVPTAERRFEVDSAGRHRSTLADGGGILPTISRAA